MVATWALRNAQYSQASQETIDLRKKELNKARRIKKNRCKKWELEYWNEMADKATQAYHKDDTVEMYKVISELKLREFAGRRDGGQQGVGDVETEREAWKDHFREVSRGRGHVNEQVWQTVPVRERKEYWMGSVPTNVELDRCVAKMKNKKKGGSDGFTAETLKFGGYVLRQKVYGVVKAMWTRATMA